MILIRYLSTPIRVPINQVQSGLAGSASAVSRLVEKLPLYSATILACLGLSLSTYSLSKLASTCTSSHHKVYNWSSK